MKAVSKSVYWGLALAWAAALTLGGLGPALASEKPAYDPYPHQVELGFVKQMVDGEKKGHLFDARPKRKKYDQGHIPTAVSLPATQFDKKAGELLPKDKDALVVFYCGGLKCSLSHKAAFKAEKMGYTNVKVFPTGYPAWKKAYGPGPTAAFERVAEALRDKGVKPFPVIVDREFVADIVTHQKVGLIVDSRPARKKYDQGHIPGAVSIPQSKFDKMKGLLPADKGALVVFYCGGLKCPLSHKSAYAARELGYKNVKVFAEGYPNWKKKYGAGAAVAAIQKDTAPAEKKKLPVGKAEGSIDTAAFEKIAADKGRDVLIVDVRDPKEFEAGHIAGSANIPVEDLEKKLKELPQDKPVVFVCGTGARAGESYYMVRDLAPEMSEVYYVDAEVEFTGDGTCKIVKPKKK
jgi:rhodanese-related sulfurtransferase